MSFAAKVLSRRRLRPRHILGLGTIALLTLWAGLWAVTAVAFNHAMDRWIEAANAEGSSLSYVRRHTDGTPFAVHIHLHDVAATVKSDKTVQAGEAVLYMNLWNWREVSAKLRGGIKGTLAGVPFTAAGLKFGFALPEQAPLSHDEPGLSLWVWPLVLAFETEKPLPFGNSLEEGFVQGRVMGVVPDFTKAEAVKAWNEEGGVIDFDRFDLRWGGLTLTASGTLGLDPALQLEGAFSGRVEGLDDAIASLVEQGLIDSRKESMLRASLHVLARPAGLTGNAAPIVPFTIQSGGLYLGPVKLAALPVLAW